MSGKKRLAIFLSILWLAISLMIGIAADESLIIFVFVLGVFPLLLIWGVWWVMQGFNGGKQNKLSGTSPLEQTEPSSIEVPKGPFFTRLWQGKVSLAVTFWFWGFLVLGVLRVIDLVAERNIHFVIEYIEWYYVFIGVSLAYGIFIWVAIWRSASNSNAKVGPGLAKLWVVLGIIATIIVYAGFFTNQTKSSYSESDVWSMAYELNKSLPTKVDNITVLESVVANKKTLTYKYTITLNDGNLNLEALRGNILSVTCTDESRLALVNDGIIFKYAYYGENGDHLGTITTSKNDCLMNQEQNP